MNASNSFVPEPLPVETVTKPGRPKRTDTRSIPAISPLLLRWFAWYGRRYVRRHFHSIRMSKAGPVPALVARPLVIYLNHASWWDPMVCLALQSQFFASRRAFAPMASSALARYPMFKRLGFFGVEQGTRRGGVQFLRTCRAILKDSSSVIWLTPQGQFEDARARPVHFKPGLGRLAQDASGVVLLPLAVEYVFWEERLPEVMIRFGEAIAVEAGQNRLAEDWTAQCERSLQATQDQLAQEVQQRESAAFTCLVSGQSGVSSIYDRWRVWKARLRGEAFNLEHGIR